MYQKIDNYDGATLYRHEGSGMYVIVWPYALAPVVALQVTYLVGSRHEVNGVTGIAHLLEHLMFKGSENFDQDSEININKLEDLGAVLNATTWMDRTNYFEVLSKNHLEKALAIEADRMTKAMLRETDRANEMPVVMNEYERGENDAFSVLYKHVWATSYLSHAYHHSTIGWKSDIENMSIEDIRSFYKKYYCPNNAYMTVIGDINENQTLELIDKYFGSIPKNVNLPLEPYTSEDVQEGERHFVIRRPDHSRWVAVSHKAPSGLEFDHIVLQVMAKILSFGQLSRMQNDLVDKGLAQYVYIDIHPLYCKGLFTSYINLTNDADPNNIKNIILSIYQDVIDNKITQEELSRAKNQILTEKAYDKDGLMGLLQIVNEGIACGSWKYGLEFSAKVESISLDDLSRVAKKYFTLDQMVTGFYLPKGD